MDNIFSLVLLISIVIIVFVIVTLGVYYIFTRKNFKQQKEHFEQLHLHLKAGQVVEFSNGLIGEIVKVEDEFCDIKIKSGAIIKVSRFAITKLMDK